MKTAAQTRNILSDTYSGAQLTRMLDEQAKIEYYVKHENNYGGQKAATGGLGNMAFSESAKQDRKLYREIRNSLSELVTLQSQSTNSKVV